MNGYTTNRSRYPIVIFLLYLEFYASDTQTPGQQFPRTFFIKKNTPWLHKYFGQSRNYRNAAEDISIVPEDTPNTTSKPHLMPDHTSINRTISNNIFQGNDVRNYNGLSMRVITKDSAKTLASNAIHKYEYKAKEGITWTQASVTFAPNWWNAYFRSVDTKYSRLENTPRIASTATVKGTQEYIQREPTRTMYPLGVSKSPQTIITRTSYNEKDFIQDHKNDDRFKNVWSWSDIPSKYVKNKELLLKNVERVFPEKEKSLLLWREFDMKGVDKKLQVKRGLKLQHIQHRLPLLKLITKMIRIS